MSSSVFISHASEDKESIVRELATTLRYLGVTVWYDESSMIPGDKIRRSVESGILNSDFAAVILSKNFFHKEWAQRELDALFSMEIAKRKSVIIPVWHEIGIDDVISYAPLLADRLAVSTKIGVVGVAGKIMQVVSTDVRRIKLTQWFSCSSSTKIKINEAVKLIDNSVHSEGFICDYHEIRPDMVIMKQDYQHPGFHLTVRACCRQFGKRVLDRLRLVEGFVIEDIIPTKP